MNRKNLACLVVGLLIFGMVQGTLWMNKRMTGMQGEAFQAKQGADTSMAVLGAQQRGLEDLKSSSKDLISYLRTWEPYFREVNSPDDAELKISIRIKQDNLTSLSQRYEVVTTKGNPSVSQVMRAHLSFEDNYARLLNWIGEMEVQLPTMRIDNLRIVQGTRPSDIKIEAVMELPLMGAK